MFYIIYMLYPFSNNSSILKLYKNYEKKTEIIIHCTLLYLGKVNVLYIYLTNEFIYLQHVMEIYIIYTAEGIKRYASFVTL